MVEVPDTARLPTRLEIGGVHTGQSLEERRHETDAPDVLQDASWRACRICTAMRFNDSDPAPASRALMGQLTRVVRTAYTRAKTLQETAAELDPKIRPGRLELGPGQNRRA